MKVLIEISPEHYDGFLNKCVHWLPEYSILKNGVVIHRQIEGADARSILILCEEYQANVLLAAARSLYNPAAEHIKNALGPARDQ